MPLMSSSKYKGLERRHLFDLGSVFIGDVVFCFWRSIFQPFRYLIRGSDGVVVASHM